MSKIKISITGSDKKENLALAAYIANNLRAMNTDVKVSGEVGPDNFPKGAQMIDTLSTIVGLRQVEVEVLTDKVVKSAMSESIYSVGLSIRTASVLNAGSIHTLGDLVGTTNAHLLSLVHMGPAGFREVSFALQRLGVYLPDGNIRGNWKSRRTWAILPIALALRDGPLKDALRKAFGNRFDTLTVSEVAKIGPEGLSDRYKLKAPLMRELSQFMHDGGMLFDPAS